MVKGLTQAVEYVQGDETKGRSKKVELKKLEVIPLKDYSKEELKSIRLQNNLTSTCEKSPILYRWRDES
jgi:hypothetical protein